MNFLNIVGNYRKTYGDNIFLYFTNKPEISKEDFAYYFKNTYLPYALYVYPLNTMIKKYGTEIENWPINAKKKYVVLIKIKNNSFILDLKKVSGVDIKILLKILRKNEATKHDLEFILNKIRKEKNLTRELLFWRILDYIKKIKNKNNKDITYLLSKMNYDVVLDEEGIILSNKPVAAILNEKAIEKYKIYKNPII